MFRIHYQIKGAGATSQTTKYATIEQAQSAIKQILEAQGSAMHISSYISTIRSGRNRAYRTAIANALKNVFSDKETLSRQTIKHAMETAEDFRYACREEEETPMSDFTAVSENGSIFIVEFHFDQYLRLEFDVDNESPTDEIVFYNYVVLADKNTSIRINIEEAQGQDNTPKKSNSENILLIYRELLKTAQKTTSSLESLCTASARRLRGISAEEIQNRLCTTYEMESPLSLETIVNHIKTLKKLGLPIKRHKFSGKDIAYWAAHGVRNTDRYEIDFDCPDTVPHPVDASECGVGINPLLVLFTIKTADGPIRQLDIASAIKQNYRVSINRKAVARHINLLQHIEEPIKRIKNGYIYIKGEQER